MNLTLTKEQQSIYDNYIKERNNMGIVGRGKKFIPQNTVLEVVDTGLNHPLYIQNDDFIRYLEASKLWWDNEPEFRKTERMSAIRGDYGKSDSWDDPEEKEYKELV
jgi:hypothetical protein